MPLEVGVVMDPIAEIKIHKDSTFAMLLELQRRGHRAYYMELGDLWLDGGDAHGRMRPVTVRDDPADWFDLGDARHRPLGELDLILMRKDPPFDMEYVQSTYLLERAQQAGAAVVNDPRALRDANEKLFTAWFPQCCAPTLVARDPVRMRAFIDEHDQVVVKPLDGMGGASVFRTHAGDPNRNVIIETLTAGGRRFAMMQRFIEQIEAGDKRILMVDGEPLPWALARIPAEGDFRGNLASGGTGKGVELTDRDRWICEQVGPELEKRGLFFVGLDVIGDWLTEVNVTSPTCIREIDAAFGVNVAGELFDALEASLETRVGA